MAITAKVLQELGFVSNKDFILDAEKDMEWLSDQPQPSDAEISAGQASWDAKEYARKRKAEYPSIEECVHAILDDDLDALQEKRAAVKAKYPNG